MQEIIQTSLTITVFVMLMMLIIEYINVKTKGQWSQPLKRKKWLQIVIAALLGAIPGCMGVYTVVSLFTHKIFSFGALVGSMIATAGDETFVMFAMMPEKAVWIMVITFILAIVAAFLTDWIYKDVNFTKSHDHHFHIHETGNKETEDKCECQPKSLINDNFKSLNFTRALILTGLILFSINLIIGSDSHNHSFSINKEVFSAPLYTKNATKVNEKISQSTEVREGHDHEALAEEHEHEAMVEEGHDHHEESFSFNLPKMIFTILTLFALFIVVTVPNHFIEEHIWNHVIKKHFLRIFLWTFGTLLLILLAKQYWAIDIADFAKNNMWLILGIAIVIGIIPQSGPHMIFISLFIAGAIPFSILLVNSIVQDGHGSLPLFAENKKAFLHMKIINMVVGALVGVAGIMIGF